MSSGIHYEQEKPKSKQKKVSEHNIRKKAKCLCGKGLGFNQLICKKCEKAKKK